MEFQDDRTPEQRKLSHVIVLATDRFMSGWGRAEGGMSYAGWACTLDNVGEVERWVRLRGDMMRVRVVDKAYRPRAGTRGHCHIYTRFPNENA